MQGVTQVYHCAAIVSFAPKDQHKMLIANQEGTANVVNACLEHKIQKLVYVSSVAALGRIRIGTPIDETMNWTSETSNSEYGKTKYLAEMVESKRWLKALEKVDFNFNLIKILIENHV